MFQFESNSSKGGAVNLCTLVPEHEARSRSNLMWNLLFVHILSASEFPIQKQLLLLLLYSLHHWNWIQTLQALIYTTIYFKSRTMPYNNEYVVSGKWFSIHNLKFSQIYLQHSFDPFESTSNYHRFYAWLQRIFRYFRFAHTGVRTFSLQFDISIEIGKVRIRSVEALETVREEKNAKRKLLFHAYTPFSFIHAWLR